MKFSAPRWLLYSLLVLVALGMIFVCSPAWDALVVGGDEGMELSKALLLSERPSAVIHLRNDQPWLYTLLLSAAFKMFGPSAGLARLFSLVSATAMLVALGWMLRQAVGGLGLLLAGIFLFSAPGMLGRSIAALPGLPAISWALVAVALSYQPAQSSNWKKLLLSGAVLACALHIQLNVLMILPAFTVFMFRQWGGKSAGRSLGLWSIGFVAAFLIIAVASPTGNLNLLFHSSPKTEWTQSGFRLSALLLNPGLILAAILGVVYTIRQQAPAPLLFASVWFATAALMAEARRHGTEPDMIQFYIPLAILGSVGFATTVSRALEAFQDDPAPNELPNNQGRWFRRRYELNTLGAITIFAFWVGFAVPDVVSDLTRLNHLPTVKHNGLCLSIRDNAQATRWCFTRFPEYAFAGGVTILPELAAIAAPRSLDHNLTSEQALQLVENYQPEQMLLAGNVEMQNQAWTAWTTNHYVLVDQDGEKQLWVSRQLHPREIQPANDLLQKLGL